MRLFDRYRQAPPSTSGRMRHDVTLGLADATLTGLWAISGAIRKMVPPAETVHTIELTVAERQVVAHDQDVIALTLVPTAGGPLPRWHPGAHIDIHLPSGLVRQYSLCGDPQSRDEYRIAVRRIPDGGGGSIEVHDTLRIGAAITTHGPRNAFPLTVPGYGSPTRRLRFIAGGIGITPILPMLGLAQRVGGADETLLSALGRARVHAPYSCQQGFCGTCRTRVLSGTVDHRDTLLTNPERDGGTMLICVSRAAEGSRLTLDL
jgi:ferredoxin